MSGWFRSGRFRRCCHVASEVDVLASISTAISAAQRGAPIKVLAIYLHRPLFWLVPDRSSRTFQI